MRIKTEQLPVGSRLSHPINDEEERLLLAAGALLTASIKQRLLDRGITDVLLHPEDAATIGPRSSTAPASATTQKSPRSPAAAGQSALGPTIEQIKAQAVALAASVSRQVKNSGPPLRQQQVARGTAPYDQEQRERLTKHFASTARMLSEIAHQAVGGKVQDDRPLKISAQDYLAELATDTDNVLATSAQLPPDPDLTQRGVRLALLGMAMAIEMDWDETHVREVGLCGLVHDFGMFHYDETLRDTQTPLSSAEQKEIADHPLRTLDLLTSMKSISLPVRLAATQVHENPDGSGYPRSLKQAEIHPYASLLHVADAYIGLTAEMRGRQAFLAYDVMVYLLNQVKAQRMDEQAVRALLQVMSLFPIGSHVRLSDGSEAQVLRRNAENYTAPIVQRVGADRKARYDSPHASIIDLAQTNTRVMSPLPPPDREETRLDESLMSKVLWEAPAR